jgi:hypothetical protein
VEQLEDVMGAEAAPVLLLPAFAMKANPLRKLGALMLHVSA